MKSAYNQLIDSLVVKKKTAAEQQAEMPPYRKELERVVASIDYDTFQPITGLAGVPSVPPRPGVVSGWTAVQLRNWGMSNGLTEQFETAHASGVRHPVFPELMLTTPHTTGDRRAILNCAADFRRTWRRFFTGLAVSYTEVVHAIDQGLQLATRQELTPADVLWIAYALYTSGDDAGTPLRKLLADNQVSPRLETEEREVDPLPVYRAMTYIARTSQVSYGSAVLQCITSIGLLDQKEFSDRTVKEYANSVADRIGVAWRIKTKLKGGMCLQSLFQALIDMAEDLRTRKDEEARERRAAREAKYGNKKSAPAATAATQDPPSFDEALRMDVEASTRSSRAFAQSLLGMGARLSDQARALSDSLVFKFDRSSKAYRDLEARLLAAQAELTSARQSMQTAMDLTKHLLARAGFLANVDPTIENIDRFFRERESKSSGVYRDRLCAFAARVHDLLSKRDFLDIAAGIREILPEAERLAITCGDDTPDHT